MNNFYKFAILGCPVRHSLSPKMHSYWMDALDVMGSYDFCETQGSEESFRQKISELQQSGYSGCNVTIPHKQHAYQICDRRSADAEFTGAVNTLIFRDGKIIGENTDILGFLQNLKNNSAYDRARETSQAVIIGAGGTARSVLYGLLQEGFKDIVVLNRTLTTAEELIAGFQQSFSQCHLGAVSFDQLNLSLQQRAEHSLVVNTTSIGMSGQGSWNVDFSQSFFVTDIVYTPIMTPFLECADKKGLDYQDGFGMLLHQGAESFRLWTGLQPVVDDQLRQYLLR